MAATHKSKYYILIVKKKKKTEVCKGLKLKCVSFFPFFYFTSLFPVIEADLSDSGCVDNVLELLVMAGDRSLPEVVLNYSATSLLIIFSTSQSYSRTI